MNVTANPDAFFENNGITQRFDPMPDAGPKFDSVIRATPFVWREPRDIPPREWLYGRAFVRGFLTATVAPGGVGKSSLSIVECLAMATGLPLLKEKVFGATPLRIWYFNGEDPLEELERRFGAAMLHYQITSEMIGDRLFLDSGRDQPIKIGRPGARGHELDRDAVDQVQATLIENRIDVAVIDPFVSFHGVEENSNSGIDLVAKGIGSIAHNARCSINVVHHTRKQATGTETTMDDARGAKALIDAARVGRVLNSMSEEEAEQAGIEKLQRFRYCRVDDGKANLAPRADNAFWFEMRSIELGNGREYLPGDNVGVPVPWQMPKLFDKVSTDNTLAVQRRLDGKAWRTDVQSPDWAGHLVAEILGLDTTVKSDKTRIKGLLAVWAKNGVIKTVNKDTEQRKSKPCYVSGVPV